MDYAEVFRRKRSTLHGNGQHSDKMRDRKIKDENFTPHPIIAVEVSSSMCAWKRESLLLCGFERIVSVGISPKIFLLPSLMEEKKKETIFIIIFIDVWLTNGKEAEKKNSIDGTKTFFHALAKPANLRLHTLLASNGIGLRRAQTLA